MRRLAALGAAAVALFLLLATFYQSTPLGPITLPELAGIPGWAGTLAVVALAGGGFALAERIEQRHR